jgi:hypothetical protein
MKLTIDSEIIDLPYAAAKSFEAYCQQVMDWLLKRNRSISICKIDGHEVTDIQQANAAFAQAKQMEIESVPLIVALQSAMAIHSARLGRLEKECESLVTDCLIAEPVVVAEKWQSICEMIKEQIGFIPRLASLLTEEMIDAMVNEHCKELTSIMMAVSECFPKADVVTFSDVLEMRLLPWIRGMREFSKAVLKLLDAIQTDVK